MLLAQRPPIFPWRTLRESGGGEDAGGIQGQPGARDSGEGQRDKKIFQDLEKINLLV